MRLWIERRGSGRAASQLHPYPSSSAESCHSASQLSFLANPKSPPLNRCVERPSWFDFARTASTITIHDFNALDVENIVRFGRGGRWCPLRAEEDIWVTTFVRCRGRSRHRDGSFSSFPTRKSILAILPRRIQKRSGMFTVIGGDHLGSIRR